MAWRRRVGGCGRSSGSRSLSTVTSAAAPLLATNAAFYVVFGAFAVAFVVLSVITISWALRQDRSGRERWLRRQQERQEGQGGSASGSGGRRRAVAGRQPAPPTTNGHRPAGRSGPSRRPPE